MLLKAETPINSGSPPFCIPNWFAIFPIGYKIKILESQKLCFSNHVTFVGFECLKWPKMKIYRIDNIRPKVSGCFIPVMGKEKPTWLGWAVRVLDNVCEFMEPIRGELCALHCENRCSQKILDEYRYHQVLQVATGVL